MSRADPFARRSELPPATASILHTSGYSWKDAGWMEDRRERTARQAPVSIYEVHLGSWRRSANGSAPGYREIAAELADYIGDMGFTHVELLPVMEHPFYGSWGYQTTSYFAPTSRYGEPDDLRFFVDHLHRNGIGVILDWVPSHFPADDHALARFDGKPLYEHPDPRRGWHPDWGSMIFDYGRPEVQSFLMSSAAWWLESYHADGLRVDAVASMLYLDFSRGDGEWIPNRDGGRENLEAVAFLKRLNETLYAAFPDIQVCAEDSTAWPGVSRSTSDGGLGFGYKWDLGWMNDTLDYMSLRPGKRSGSHKKLTFRSVYQASENFILPLSHDEVVYGKGSLLGRMPGTGSARFDDLRLLLGYMWAMPGKKLLFMGGEFGQVAEWNHDAELEWDLLDVSSHRGVREWVRALNALYRAEPSLHRLDCEPAGFEWVEADDDGRSVLAFLRHGGEGCRPVLAVANFSDRLHEGYEIGVPRAGRWEELLRSDDEAYGGTAHPVGTLEAGQKPTGRFPARLCLDLSPRSIRLLG
jgi:1,4-alpha-glucan branching enzyme